MTRYPVAIHHPDGSDPSPEGEAMERDIDALDDELVAAGVRVFVGGLSPARSARPLRVQPDGKVLINDGPCPETNEHNTQNRARSGSKLTSSGEPASLESAWHFFAI
jgi:hypothetical protein